MAQGQHQYRKCRTSTDYNNVFQSMNKIPTIIQGVSKVVRVCPKSFKESWRYCRRFINISEEDQNSSKDLWISFKRVWTPPRHPNPSTDFQSSEDHPKIAYY